MKAFKIAQQGKAEIQDVPIPALRSPEHVIVKTVAVALNPTDWKHIEWVKDSHPAVGCDFAGVVHEVGSNITHLKKGDKVWGVTHGSNAVEDEDGAFGEYLTTKAGVCQKIPEGMGFEDAATLGVAVNTVGQGLYQQMGLPWPETKEAKENAGKWLLVYGASSAMGAMGVQFGSLSGFKVIGVCSPRNYDYVKSLGAKAVFDYSSPTCSEDIRKLTNDQLYYAWDCIGEHGSLDICAAALSSSPPDGQVYWGTILAWPESFPRDDIKGSISLGYTAFGEAFQMDERKFDAQPDHYEWASRWFPFAQKLLSDGKWRPHNVEVRSGGLEGIQNGLNDLKENRVSGVKLVYRIADS